MNNNRSSRAQEVRAVGTPRVVDTLIIHPDKLWWSEEGITKLETAQYYAEVAPRLLPWLNNRLLTVERCPEGIEGGCFFEKNFAKGLPEGVPTLAVPAESSGKTVHYVVGGSKQTILALVNLGCIAVHVMNCEVGSLDLPDWLAFDLDPSSGLFADAAKAAFLLRELLERMRIRSFPKTTGGRGLHVLVPFAAGSRPGASATIRSRHLPGAGQEVAPDHHCRSAQGQPAEPGLCRLAPERVWADHRRALLGSLPAGSSGFHTS